MTSTFLDRFEGDMMYKERNNYRILAEEFYFNENPDMAIRLYKKALKYKGKKEDTLLILFNLGVIYNEIGDIKSSIKYYQKIIEIDPTYKDANYQLAIIYEDLGQIKKAILYYKRVLRLDPNHTLSMYNLAVLFDNNGKDEDSEKLYNKILNIDPHNHYALNNLGSIYESRKDFNKAYELIKKSIEIEDNFYLSHFNFGVVLKALGEIDNAIDHYFKSIRLKPDYEYTYLNLSAIYIEKGEINKSIEILTIGINRCNIVHDLYYNRACSYAILNNKDKAIIDIETCLDLSPNLIRWIEKDKDFDDLRNDSKFTQIINKSKNLKRKDSKNDNN